MDDVDNFIKGHLDIGVIRLGCDQGICGVLLRFVGY